MRNGSGATKQAYAEALGFESVLVQELASSMSASGSPAKAKEKAKGKAQEKAPPAQPQGFSSMTPQALSSAIMSDGGLGLAAQLTHSLQGVSPVAAAVSGGTAAQPAGASSASEAAASVAGASSAPASTGASA